MHESIDKIYLFARMAHEHILEYEKLSFKAPFLINIVLANSYVLLCGENIPLTTAPLLKGYVFKFVFYQFVFYRIHNKCAGIVSVLKSFKNDSFYPHLACHFVYEKISI